STEAEPCWSARMLFSRDYKTDTGLYQDGPSDETLIGFYTYHLDGPSDRGEIITWDDDVALLDHGQWYCVEGRIDLNTPGMNDGILEGWVDGELAYSRSDFKWRRASESFLDVEMFWLDFYYGKEGEGSTKSMEIRFDSLALGPERIGCDDALVWNGAFMDDDGSVFESDIEWLAASGITKSCNPPDDNRFCPDDVVTRGQMAAFLGRALDLTEGVGEDYFTDDNASVFENDIDRFAHAGITKGCTATTFCPGSGITREQMAAFLTRAYDLPATDEDFFTDDEGSIFEDAINRLAASGITTGCSATTFCGSDSVTRAQMAAFLKRAES
ncbi:MAG: S-layer homology domain-containing protein, partial [Acidimicrobiia bacterium]|nr:S-layer homology domain-containing protein [Acidimicrobiia bacterium]